MASPAPLPPFVPPQPTLSRFSLRGLLSLPRRLCSPPAAVGKVRSFGLTPIFDVRLEDVLDRKHLPPLSLKDFEEWLLYVEQSVENLYFVLWLREYTAKYDRWIAKVRAREAKTKQHGRVGHTSGHPAHSPGATYRVAWSNTTPTSPALALFFSRARDTFLVPGAPYELSLPPALLDALAVVNGHPDPAVFAPARAHVEEALRGSLNRCVRAAYSNVGTYRAACGIAAGIFILLVGTVPPLAVNFVKAQSRWERLVILPGLWLGLTVLIASLRGICMMIYIFGDFRQLRKFELVRPPPPTAAQSRVSVDSGARTPTAVTVPARPVQALTAPPRIAIRIPTRTPTLSYGTSTSTTVSTTTDFSGTGTQTSTSYTNTTSHVHTISISSVKSRGGTSTLVFPPHHQRHGSTNVYADSETRSVPGVYASDDEESFDEDEDEDGASTASDHGIYISPAMPSPEAVAEDDPAVVNAALALIASGGSANGSTGQVCAVGVTPVPASPTAAATSPTAVATSSVTVPSTTTTKAGPAVAQNALLQMPTAPFIPAYPYSDADSVRASRRRGGHRHCPSRSRSQSVSKADLEACVSSASPEAAASVQKLGAFDFDALPIPPVPPTPTPAPMMTKAPAPLVPTLSVPASRPRPPERCLDTNLGAMGIGMNEKSGLTMLPSPCSGLTTSASDTAHSPSSPFARSKDDDEAGLCEKGLRESGDARNGQGETNETDAGKRRLGRPSSSNWHGGHSGEASSSSRRNSKSRINLNLPFFFRLPRLFSLFHPRHHHHHSDSTGYDAFSDYSPYSAYSSKASSTKTSSGRRSPGGWRTRCALEARVPAFGPVTRVLAPVVARAQWEIVVRAACLAALLSGTAIGVLVSLPVPGEV